ncbi:MAG: 4a-hydroxytetrahydrobiopterin dehydratase [Jatrophihabitantaceae bacterium]
MKQNVLTQDAVDQALATLHDGWSGTTQQFSRSIEFADFLTAVRFIDHLAPHCEAMDHHPDLDLRWRRVDLVLSTHTAGGVTALDAQLAGIIDEIAADLPRAD